MVSVPDLTKTTVLVVAGPGPMRDSLLAFLEAAPGLGGVRVVNDPATAWQSLRGRRHHTLLLDAEPDPQSTLSLVRQLHAEAPAHKFVVLVNNLQQQRAFLAAGATDVLLKGRLDDRLRAAIQDGAGRNSETMNAKNVKRKT